MTGGVCAFYFVWHLHLLSSEDNVATCYQPTDRRIVVRFGKPSSKASHAKLHASKVVPFCAMKTCKACRGIAPHIGT
jgi:hypothetical protein